MKLQCKVCIIAAILWDVTTVLSHHTEEAHTIDESLNELDQEDPRLINFIQERILITPDPQKKLNLTRKHLSHSVLGGQFGQPYVVDKLYKGKKENGFFIEAGASDGEAISNTLFFEIKRGWTGLLIEPNPEFFQNLTRKGRNAYLVPHCLSTKRTPEIVNFDASALIGGIINEGRIKPGDIGRPKDYINRPYHRRTIRVQCFPLYSLLQAVGNPKVDYFSLDIEGAEFPVLKTIPFDKVDLRLIDIEFNHLGKVFDGSEEEVISFMNERGYDLHEKVGIDALFVKRMKRGKKSRGGTRQEL